MVLGRTKKNERKLLDKTKTPPLSLYSIYIIKKLCTKNNKKKL